jgi:hypothetical protein
MQLTSVEFQNPVVMPTPWLRSHQRIAVATDCVTAIEVKDGTLIITRDRRRYVLHGLTFSGIAADESNGLKCERCNEPFATGQALGMHRKTCTANGKRPGQSQSSVPVR